MCQWNVVISAKNFEMPRAIQITTLNEILLTLNNIACLAAIITCFFLSFNKKQLFWTYLCFSFLWWKRVFFLKLEVDLLYVKLLTWKKERKDKWCFFFKKKYLQLMEWKKNLLQCQCDSINDMISNQKSIARNTMIIYFEIDFYLFAHSSFRLIFISIDFAQSNTSIEEKTFNWFNSFKIYSDWSV